MRKEPQLIDKSKKPKSIFGHRNGNAIPEETVTAPMPHCKQHISRAILDFMYEYESNVESFNLKQDQHEIVLTIKLPPKLKIETIMEDFT